MRTPYHTMILSRDGSFHKVTADQIIQRIKHDRSINSKWTFSPEELIYTISEPDFPEGKAREIKILILNHCSEGLKTEVWHGEVISQIIAGYCYRTLPQENYNYPCVSKSKAVCAKIRYRQNIIRKAVRDLPKGPVTNQALRDNELKTWTNRVVHWASKDEFWFISQFGSDPARWQSNIKKSANDMLVATKYDSTSSR